MRITQHWRLRAQRYRLEGSICQTCGQMIFPPRPRCPNCQEGLVVEAAIPAEIAISEMAGVPPSMAGNESTRSEEDGRLTRQ